MSPSDKNEGSTNSDSKEERESQRQEVVKPNGMDQSPGEATSSTTEAMIPEHGTVTNIPLFTAKLSTLKCSDNDQMKTFDPGESSNNDNVMNNQCGYQLKFPIKNSVTKNNKNYKAGSKINKLADMLAKRSQNLVEMTQNVTSEVIADIISAPKVENNRVDSELNKTDDKVGVSGVLSEKTVSKQPINSVNESQNKSVPNENSENVNESQLSHKCCSDISEVNLKETNITEFNALKEHLVKSETDGSTKSKKEIRKNLKNVELSLILPEKKRRSSPRNKIVISDISKDSINDSYHEGKLNVKALKTEENIGRGSINEQTKVVNAKTDKTKSTKQRKSKRLVETSTQTSTTDFVCVEGKKGEPPEPPTVLEQSKSESDAEQPATDKTEASPKDDPEPETKEKNPETTEDKPDVGDSVDNTPDKQESPLRSDSETNPDDVLRSDLEIKETEKCVYACMYCTATFITRSECKDHEKSHSPKKNKQNTKCQFCNKQFQSFYDLKLHCIKNHPNKYAYCVKCDERFCEKTQLYSHNKMLHVTKAMEAAQNLVKLQETLGISLRGMNKDEIDEMRKAVEKKGGKTASTKSDLKVDVSFDTAKKSSTSPRTVQKISPRENKTEEQLLEMEMLFYSHLSGNIKENLTNHLDGKIDKNGNPIQTDLVNDSSENSQAKVKSTNLLSVVTANSSGAPDQVSRAPSPYQTRSKTPNPLPPTAKKFKKLPNWQQKFWEKYNFPTNYRYEHRFWDKNYLNTEKSALYLKDLSCLDIKTQLTMRENIKKLDSIKCNEENNKPSEKLTFPEYLSLVPKVSDGSSQRNASQGNNPDSLKGKNQGFEERKPKTVTTDSNRSRRKISADNSKRQPERYTKTSDGSKMMTRRQSVIELSKGSKNEDTGKRRKGSLDVTETQKMTLRRQTSLDNLQRLCGPESSSKTEKPNETGADLNANPHETEDNLPCPIPGFAEISGEWVRPRSYLCGTCCAKFTNLWELEDHKWVSHPNVWCTHYEFEDEKIDKLFHRSDVENAAEGGTSENSALSKLKLTDLYKRYLLPHGSLKTAKLVPNVSFPEQCTKCKKNCMSLSEMHKHMLDCGGDTTWFLTMYSSPMTMKRKWRPFGSRRRKQIGRRMLKRNIPNTSNMRPYHYQHRIRTKPGDVESIQKMLANLPEKRARRAINFDEIKTRSQATIHSNRLLRKRFKVSFGTNIMRLKALKQQRQTKSVKKESSSKSTTDTSSENTPTSSPKRRNKMRDSVQLPKDETLIIESVQETEPKKKSGKQSKKKESSAKQDSSKKGSKKGAQKPKPLTRSNTVGDTPKESRDKKKKGQIIELAESVPKTEIPDVSRADVKDKKSAKGKASKKKSSNKVPDKQIKKEMILSDVNITTSSPKAEAGKKKTKTDVDDDIVASPESVETVQEKKKGKKGKLTSKNILRLKSNDKEKTELIKRIRKTLRNSKRILEKRENKDKYEIRRSLRIQTLQLTDVSPKSGEDVLTPEKSVKEVKESHTPDIKPLLSTESSSSTKKLSKPTKNMKGTDSKNNSGDIDVTPGIRRSSRAMSSTLTEEPLELSPHISTDKPDTTKKFPEITRGNTSEANQSELAETIKRSPVHENSLIAKAPEDNSDPLIGYEFESIKKPARPQNVRNIREAESNKYLKTAKNTSPNQEPGTPEKAYESKNLDLSEMPVLDKEEPVRGRTKRKSESEIPVLMPYENDDKIGKSAKEAKSGKRKGMVTFKVVNKRRKSTERVDSLKIVKETEVVPEKGKEKARLETKTESITDVDDSETQMKKRKRNYVVNQSPSGERKVPKTPKVKKYFLGICPNEIDKGGESKDDSGSDSEPLITLVMNQKLKVKSDGPPELKVQEPSPEQPTENDKTEEIIPVPLPKETGNELDPVVNEKPNKDVTEAPSPEVPDEPIPPVNDLNDKTPEETEKTLPKQVEHDLEVTKEAPPLEIPDVPKEKPDEATEYELKKPLPVKKSLKGLKMTVKLKEATLKIVDCAAAPTVANKWSPDTPEPDDKITEKEAKTSTPEEPKVVTDTPEVITETKMERRSRRVSKEIKSTTEFVLDDPLILVDELWSDLDSDSDNSKRRSKKGRKKSAKKKAHEEKKDTSVNLEELLRNFGESKNSVSKSPDCKKLSVKVKLNRRRNRKVVSHVDKRKRLENRFVFEERSYKRLSLRLFKFHKKFENFGGLGRRLLHLKRGEVIPCEPVGDFKAQLPLPFLAAEIQENPVQIIQCGAQKGKIPKKSGRKSEKPPPNMQLKISLPLQSINNLAVLNNNHLTEVVEDMTEPKIKTVDVTEVAPPQKEIPSPKESVKVEESAAEPVSVTQKEEDEPGDLKLKPRRSEVIDKIFYCEICQTYYYSSSQLKIHKLSNRHKMKELELSQIEEKPAEVVPVQPEPEQEKEKEKPEVAAPPPPPANEPQPNSIENVDADKLNDDTSEMPILEGPFIENPFVRLGMDNPEPPPKPAPPPSVFGFTEDCLKDIQKAIGCTDEEMLILTLLGENSIELENDILDLDSCQPDTSNQLSMKTENTEETKERENSNGLLKMDFKKRITSALARLVNKAVLNLLQKYKNTNRTGISPEALSFLIKLSKVNNKKNLLELDELLKNESEGESSNRIFVNEDKKEHDVSPYQCNICGARFPKESTREWHILRSHRATGAKNPEEVSPEPVSANEEDKEEPYKYLCTICGARFQKESTRECHIIRTHRNKVAKSVEEPSSSPAFIREEDKKEQNAPYKYLCTICGSRFQKESMWECHIKRSHKSKGKKNVEEVQIAQTTYEDDWSSTWTYDINDELSGSVETPQFLCSDCGINFLSPQEVLEHQKLEHSGQKDSEVSESGPLQSSTIGSSDEIIKGRRTPRRGPKHLSKAELDQQRIIANNELRKLDRKFSNKNKPNKVKWGMDALKFTVEKENKAVPEPEEKEVVPEESPKPQVDPKNIDIIPKLNLSRTSNIPEFKVVQKTSCLNRFQRILDNKMKRKSTRGDGKDLEEKETIEKVFVEPVSVVKKERKRKPNRCNSKKDDPRKVFDVYDFNDSESEPEPVAFSHVKKTGSVQSPTKLKLVKVKDSTETSKNKADSTTKDFETEEYDSEDSLPLSVVKKTKAEEDDEEIRGEDQVEKHEGILEQVEYLIEQLENETNQPKSKEDETEKESEKDDSVKEETKTPDQKKVQSKVKVDVEYPAEEESVDSQPETFRVSLENKFLQLESIALKKKNEELENVYESQESLSSDGIDKTDETTTEKPEEIVPVADSSQGISDEEDSLPLVLMSKKNSSESIPEANIKKPDETSRDLSFTREETSLTGECEDEEEDDEEDEEIPVENDIESPKTTPETLPMMSSNENEENSQKSDKSYETLNGNVIYRRNDSMSGFESDSSDYEGIDSNPEKIPSHESGESLIKEVMEREDVVIVCSKKEQDKDKSGKKKPREPSKRRKQSTESVQRKKKILPLLSVTLEENNFRKSESPKLSKEVIMKKIWSRRKFPEDLPDDSENSMTSRDNEIFSENTINEDSHSEIDKEIIMKKIWNKKRLEHESENGEVQVTKLGDKPDDIKINQTEISDEVVIKCGPKAKATPKRRKSKSSTKESSKERIMRKIWSGKCTFQTKAALKTYDSDILNSSKENDTEEQNRAKKRGRPANFINSKKTKVLSDGEKSDEDDLDSLLEEIEREEVEKAIRLEFLQLRRSDKANVEMTKESGNMTVGLFAETCHKQGRELADRRRKRIRKNVKHPRKNLLKRRKFIKKPMVKSAQPSQQPEVDGEDGGRIPASVEGRLKPDTEPSDGALGTNRKSFDLESKIKNRKHKKHRHKHHHHKHKHKKSKHRKYVIGKHKIKHKSGDGGKEKSEEFENFSILEKMCDDIPNQIEKQSQKRFNTELHTLDTKLDEILMSTTSSSFDGKAKECDDVFYEERSIETNRNYGIETGSIYEFVEDDSGFLCASKDSNLSKNRNTILNRKAFMFTCAIFMRLDKISNKTLVELPESSVFAYAIAPANGEKSVNRSVLKFIWCPRIGQAKRELRIITKMSRFMTITILVAVAVLFADGVLGGIPKECDPEGKEYDASKCMEICLNDNEHKNESYCKNVTQLNNAVTELAAAANNITAVPKEIGGGDANPLNSTSTVNIPNIALYLPVVLLSFNKVY